MSLAEYPEVEHFHDDELDVAACYDPVADETFVLVLVGEHHCGWMGWRRAPGWKTPAEHGGGFYADQCPRCLGAAEWNEEWWPRSDFEDGDGR